MSQELWREAAKKLLRFTKPYEISAKKKSIRLFCVVRGSLFTGAEGFQLEHFVGFDFVIERGRAQTEHARRTRLVSAGQFKRSAN
jgi:hypothetical protein